MVSIEVKNIIDWIINKFIKIINIEHFKLKVSDFISEEYTKGITNSEIEFNMNFVSNEKEISFLNDYVFNNLKTHTDAMGEALRGELSRGILNKEKISQLKTRIKDVFKDKKYTNRLKTVLRTEKIRANNYGALEGAKQSGLNLRKYIDIVEDENTSSICKKEDKKYGEENQAIPLDQEFIIKVDNKTIRAQSPPFHPNCRSVIRFVKEEEIKNIEEKGVHKYIRRWRARGSYQYEYPGDNRKKELNKRKEEQKKQKKETKLSEIKKEYEEVIKEFDKIWDKYGENPTSIQKEKRSAEFKKLRESKSNPLKKKLISHRENVKVRFGKGTTPAVTQAFKGEG